MRYYDWEPSKIARFDIEHQSFFFSVSNVDKGDSDSEEEEDDLDPVNDLSWEES